MLCRCVVVATLHNFVALVEYNVLIREDVGSGDSVLHRVVHRLAFQANR